MYKSVGVGVAAAIGVGVGGAYGAGSWGDRVIVFVFVVLDSDVRRRLVPTCAAQKTLPKLVRIRSHSSAIHQRTAIYWACP